MSLSKKASYQFPDDFIWGTATAAYQIEGAVEEDGRKPCVWDMFSRAPGRTLNGDTGRYACDHYHRYEDDIKLMADLGLKNYRLSISWPRILPDGTGTVNDKGIDFYKRLLDCLGKHGITPWITLFHWDSPYALEEKYGSWQSRQMAYDFADYCSVVVKALGDRAKHWWTVNEISCFTGFGYSTGEPPIHAPGTIVETEKQVQQTIHHALLAHGLGAQAIRANTPQPCSVGVVDNTFNLVPLTETEADIEAAKKAFRRINGSITVPLFTGEYDPGRLADLGPDAPDIEAGDAAIIKQPFDMIGLNLYSASYVRAPQPHANDATQAVGYEKLPIPPGYPHLHMPWLQIVPDTIYWACRHISETMEQGDTPIYITENGCAADDRMSNDGEVLDTDRLVYLREHLRQAHRTVDEGLPLKGYFLWSFMDNFEWAWGYDRRFGIIYNNYETQQRTPKTSAKWYAECIKQNRVV